MHNREDIKEFISTLSEVINKFNIGNQKDFVSILENDLNELMNEDFEDSDMSFEGKELERVFLRLLKSQFLDPIRSAKYIQENFSQFANSIDFAENDLSFALSSKSEYVNLEQIETEFKKLAFSLLEKDVNLDNL
jgi:hypothetical protein